MQQGPGQQAAAAGAERQEGLPIVRSIQVEGARIYTREQLLSALGQTLGEPLDRERIARGIQVLWDTYRVRGQVDQSPAAGGGVDLRLSVEEQDLDFAPRFLGNERVSIERLLEWSRLESNSELYLNEADAVARRVQTEYLREGYYFSEVVPIVREGDRDTPPDVIFSIVEGPRVKIRAIEVSGNESMRDRGWGPWRKGLRAEAKPKLRGPRWFGLFPKYLVEEELDRDIKAMRDAYRDEGFLDAVVQLERLDFTDSRKAVDIHIVVDEGPRYIVDELRIEAFDLEQDPTQPGRARRVPADLLLDEQELLDLAVLKVGEPYFNWRVEVDKREYRRRYGELGHIAHPTVPALERFQFLEPELVVDPEGATVSVLYRLSQGLPQTIRDVRFTGNVRTQDRVMRRELSVFPGEPADLVQIERSLARLRSLRFFSASGLKPDHREPSYRFVPTDDPAVKDIEFAVEEGESIRFDFGVQLGSDNGFAGQFGVTFDNFDISRWPSLNDPLGDIYRGDAWRGAGQTMRLFFAPGTDFSRYEVLFTEPDLFRDHLDRVGTTVFLRRRLRGFNSHDERRDAIGIDLFKQLDPDTQIAIGWEHTDIRVDDIFVGGEPSLLSPETVPGLLLEQEGDSQLDGIELQLSRKRVDSARTPREGYRASGGVTVYTELLGGDYNFFDVSFSGEYYGWLDGEAKRGASYRVRGLASSGIPFGDTDNVPYTERDFLGGSRWLRGFDFRGVGPTEEGFAVGGESLAALSIDVLWPLLSQSQPGSAREFDLFRGGFFVDAGVLGQRPFEYDLSDMRASAGVTLGLVVPLPISLNWGFPFLYEDDDDRQTFSFTVTTF